jgi:hypothetical protein
MAQIVENLLSKHLALSLNPTVAKQKNKSNKKDATGRLWNHITLSPNDPHKDFGFTLNRAEGFEKKNEMVWLSVKLKANCGASRVEVGKNQKVLVILQWGHGGGFDEVICKHWIE